MDFFSSETVFLGGELLGITSFLFRDILYLRICNIVSQMIFVFGTLYAGLQNPGMKVILVFSLLCIVIHTKESIRIIRERIPIQLPIDIIKLYSLHFHMMSTKEFLKVYQLSFTKTYEKGDDVTVQGEALSKLKLIKQGIVQIIKDNQAVTTLGAGFFIGEMSFLKGGAANATTSVESKQAECIEWDRDVLEKLKLKNLGLYTKLEQAIAFNLIQKLNQDEN